MLADALLFQLGYNASLVTLGALLRGIAAGVAGTFLFLRKRAERRQASCVWHGHFLG